MAGLNKEIQFFHKISERGETNWLWVVTPDYSGLIGYKTTEGIDIFCYNRFTGKIDFSKKGFSKPEPETVKSVLINLEKNITKFVSKGSDAA